MFPGLELIAAEAGCSERKAGDAVRVLVDGDAERGLPPLFTRKRRRKATGQQYAGYGYEFVRDAEATQAGRARYAQQTEAIAAVIAGRSHPGRNRVKVPPDAEPEAAALQERRRAIEVAWCREQISEQERATELGKIAADAQRLARRVQRRSAKPTDTRKAG